MAAKGCLKGCGVFLLVIVVVGIIAGLLILRVPQMLLPSAAERNLELPDRVVSVELLAEAQARGLNTTGVDLYVLPYKEKDESVAVVLLDASEGFRFDRSGDLGAVANTFVQVAGGRTAERANVSFVTMVFTSEKGDDLITMSAPREDILKFANGQLTREQFIEAIDGHVNMPAYIQEQYEAVQTMFE